MPLKPSDRLRGAPRGTADQAIAALDRPDDKDRLLVRTIFRWAPEIDVDPAIMISQIYHETASLTSRRWNRALNAAGIGLPADDTPQPFVIPNAEAAALIYLSAVNMLLGRELTEPWAVPAEAERWLESTWRDHCLGAPPVNTIADLNIRYPDRHTGPNATWAWDPDYARKLVAMGNAIFSGLPDQGEEQPPVAPPVYDIRNDIHAALFGLSVAERDHLLTRRFERRAGGSPKYIVLHIQDGSTRGSLDWWVNGPGVQASATVMANRDGSILRVIPEEHGPWTNGDVSRPTAESAGLRALGGNPNQWSLTIEAEGKPFDAMPQTEVEAIAWQVRTWMARYGIPRKHVIRHSSINSVSRQNCPGPYAERVLALVDGAGPAPEPTPTPPTEPDLGIEGLDVALARGRFGSVTYRGITYAFDPDGPITNLWLARGKAEGVYPELVQVERFDDRTYWSFSDGWTVWRPNDRAPARVQR